jgi:hypothetical protein
MGWDWPTESYKDDPEKLERHRKERSENGFSTFDWWSFDTYIAGVIGNAVLKFANEGMGYPGDMTEESWKAFCLEIAEPLIKYSEDKFDLSLKEEEELYEEVQKAMHKFADRFGTFWD